MATIKQKFLLLLGLLGGYRARSGPIYVDVDLTRRCNLRCLGCPYQNPDLRVTEPLDPQVSDLPYDLFVRLCDELAALGTRVLILQGTGEPLLHPKAGEMISAAKQRGFKVIVVTNGILLDTNLATELAASGPDMVKVSLWAASSDQYKQNYRTCDPANLSRVWRGIGNLCSARATLPGPGPCVSLSYIYNRHNVDAMEEVIEQAQRAGCDAMEFSPMHNFRGALSSHMLSKRQEREMRSALPDLAAKLNVWGIAHNIDRLRVRLQAGEEIWRKYPCYIPWIHARVRVDGMVQICGRCDASVNFGDLRKQVFGEIWNGPALQEFRRQTITCAGLETVMDTCDCTYCSFLYDIHKVHLWFRWLRPLAAIGRLVGLALH